MAVRHKKPCSNCPQPVPNVVPQTTRPPLPAVQVTTQYDVSMDEGLRLWKWCLFGTSTAIGMIEGFALMEMPGDPREALKQMRDRLNKILTALESRDVTDASPERLPQSSSDNDSSPQLGDDNDSGRQPQDVRADSA